LNLVGWIFVGDGIPLRISRLYRFGVIDESAIRERFEALAPVLDERARRRFAAVEAKTAGHGGIMAVMRATGIARSTIGRGLAELRTEEPLDPDRVRRPGGGRSPLSETDPSLLDDLRSLVEPETRGDPQSPLLWTCKSLRKLSQSLGDMGHKVGRTLVGELLHKLDYRLQANRKTREGSNHPDRNAQFQYINDRVKDALAADEPAISVDTKKKELVGDFKNGGREWRPKGSPEPVRVHDFLIPELGRAVPYGVYDIAGNVGWVSVGIDHDTAAFAANAIRSWWTLMGRQRYPNARSLLITADGGGSNGSRVRLWKIELQKLADELGIPITVCHLPPGTSKWNKIEHRLFSFITGNWRGKPLVSHQVIVQLIAATTTKTGLTVRCELDPNTYPAGIKVSDAEMGAINLTRHHFHGEWNYTVSPKALALER
jgi:Rhodopirellula transposase DDE domain